MSTAFVHSRENEFRGALLRLRNEVAIFRTLMSELDRLEPVGDQEVDVLRSRGLGAQIVEEFGRLGCRFFECAATAAGEGASPRRDVGRLTGRR